jgi:alkylation response protein AidB-like acyl-CoA dehydrogenase
MTASVTASAALPPTPSLSAALLEACGTRAATYDRENRFFDEDFAALRDAGYLTLAVPQDLGGAGCSLADVARDVRCGGFHPANSLLTHEIVGKTALGIDLGEQPRWG